ncbi:Crp/Fnr family transcriptional regulator [Chitinophaga vietnamensis]|uniref:Crp/Fnr family transcriptional regulator n=1 Tax=Chitinophaga vietnamensis TaxID=2593957 RepID=UPI0011777FF5|nr:Crp/Fnr family transcriptional regulator [Chitinophaga vietnamensis]
MPDLQTMRQQLQALLQTSPHAAFDGSSQELFEALLEPVSFASGTYLSAAGKVADRLFYICTGIVRVVTMHEEKEISMDFAFPGMFSCSYASFITQTPAVVAIQAVTPVTAYAASYNQLQGLYEKSHESERVGRLIAEQQYLRKYRRELSFLQYTAQERYQQLLAEYPEVIQHIPVKQIASYLGIEPESLSRIRKHLKT